MNQITIDASLCTRDGLCVIACPARLFIQPEKATVPEVVNAERCIACGHCVAICHSGAIAHSAYPPGSVSPVRSERVPGSEAVLELLRSRRSIRAFRPRPLQRETLEQIIDAARFAPSGHNDQSTEFVAVLDSASLQEISSVTVGYFRSVIARANSPLVRLVASLVHSDMLRAGLAEVPRFERIVQSFDAGEDPILHHAPALLAFHARRDIGLADANALLALQNASLMAHSLGVGHFITGWVMLAAQAHGARAWSRRMHQALGIPPENELHAALALGYPLLTYAQWIERRPARVRWL